MTPQKIMLLCELCGENLPEDQYKKHKVKHQLGELPEETINPMTGKPDGEHLVPVEEKKPIMTPELAEAHKILSVSPPNEPIALHYVFTGTCPTCNEVVKTIELKGIPEKDKTTVVAWCAKEERNIQQRIVAKI